MNRKILRTLLNYYQQNGLKNTAHLICTKGPLYGMLELRNYIYRQISTVNDYHSRFSENKKHESYKERGMDQTSEFIYDVLLDNNVDTDDEIIELGCNIGRHLNYLHENGYELLYGIELNEDAVSTMEDEYPDMYNCSNIYNSTIEEKIKCFDENQFQALFSITVFQHIHKDSNWIFDEIARVTNNIIITIELEEPYILNKWHYHYRNYNDIFSKRGFRQILEMEAENAPIANHLKDKPHKVRVFKQN